MQSTSPLFNKNQEERRKKRAKLIWGALFLCIVLVVALVAGLRHPWIQIQGVVVGPVKTLDTTEVLRHVEHELTGNYVWVIPKTNTLLFSKQHMIQSLEQTFPQIAATSLTLDHEKKLHVDITEKESFGLWCLDESMCYFIDDKGILFREAPKFSRGVYLTFHGTTREQPSVLRDMPFTLEKFQALRDLVQKFQTHRMIVSDVSFDNLSGDITLTSDMIRDRGVGGVKILLHDTSDLVASFESIDLLFQEKKFQEQFNGNPEDLESIDVRFPGKIFYKFRTVVTPPVLPVAPAKKP
jgi:cell division septal protein FtsQ